MKNGKTKNREMLYLPASAKVIDVTDLTADVKLFRIEKARGFSYSPGQFLMASVWGAGEVPISITSTDSIHGWIELCIRKVGSVTSALHGLKAGDKLGVRGPFGNSFPFETFLGKDLLFVAGGIGLAPLRSLINLVMSRRSEFGRISFIYGSRNPSEVLFLKDIRDWEEKGMNVTLTVDVKNASWKHNTGLVTDFLAQQEISFKKGAAFICGPHVMIKSVMRDLSLMGMPPAGIITTLEAHMKCGVGKCGHCYEGGRYICTDGPVFSYSEIRTSRVQEG